MRCPPRALNMVMDAMNAVLLWRLATKPPACVAEKSPLTNRVRRYFARIKAGPDRTRLIMVTEAERDQTRPGVLREVSSPKLRKRQGCKPGRSCRPPSHFRLRLERASDARFRPRPPARRCDRPYTPSAPRGSACGPRAPSDRRRAAAGRRARDRR